MSTAAPMQKLPLITLPLGQHERGIGELVSTGTLTKICLPLSGVDIKAKVADRIATVEMHQRFINDHKEAIECVYVFPLSGGCAVSDFEMRVGTRIIKGVVEERAAARQQYQQALSEGKRAALLEQERDDVFTVQVGNIPPGEEVSVVLTYSEKLAFFEDGRTQIILPLVVAPRYIPGEQDLEGGGTGTGTETDTDLVPDASRISPPRLAPGFDPQVALNIEVEITSAEQLIVEDIMCSQHATKLGMSADAIKVALSRTDEALDRDFVLSWRLASTNIVSNLLTYKTESGDHYAMLSILPPASEVVLTVPRDVVFVLDRSGSMEGEKMVWAAKACANLLATLRPTDRFAILAFDDLIEWFTPMPKRNAQMRFSYADEAGIAKGCDYLREITARGGTEMHTALSSAFNQIQKSKKDDDERIPVVIMLTDGDVGDESRIFQLIQSRIGEARLFTIGVDSAVNTGILRRAAQLGGGTATFVQPGSQIEEALRSVAREIGPPVLTDISIDDAGKVVQGDSLTPQILPDVFAGRAACVFLKLTKNASFKIKGTLANGKKYEEKVTPTAAAVPAIAQLWAKSRITDMEDWMRLQPNYPPTLKKSLIALAIEHRILTRFTAFLAVDHSEIANESGKRLEVVQPVEQPAGWAEAGTNGLARQASNPGQPGRSSLMGQLVPQRNRAVQPPSQIINNLSPEEIAALDDTATGWSSLGGTSFGAAPPPPQQSAGGGGWGSPLFKPDAAGRADDEMLDELCVTGGLWGAASPAAAPAESADDAELAEPAAPSAPTPASMPTPANLPPATPPLSKQKPQVAPKKAQKSQPGGAPPPDESFGTLASQILASNRSKQEANAPKDVAALLPSAIMEFLDALLASWKNFQSGKQVDAADLEKKRQSALSALAGYPNGHKVPLIQNFLRSAAVELIRSLKAKGATADNIKPLWEGHMSALESAREEAANSAKEKRFWEKFI